MTSSLWCANGFYGAEDAAELYEQFPRRASCRRFRAAPSQEQWQSLTSAAKNLTLPGARLVPGLCDTDLFRPLGGILMKFENVRGFVGVVSDGTPEGALNAGVSGEMLLLKAYALGLAGVWVSGTYKRTPAPVALEPGERLLALIALGVPPEDFTVGKRKRKPLSKLLGGPPDMTNTLLMDVALAVQAAPSAVNSQPWRLRQEADKPVVLSVASPVSRLDLGIAAAHMILALGGAKATLTLGPDALSVRAKPIL